MNEKTFAISVRMSVHLFLNEKPKSVIASERQLRKEVNNCRKSAEVLKRHSQELVDIFAQITFSGCTDLSILFLSSNRNFCGSGQRVGFPRIPCVKFCFLIREFVGIMVAFFRGQLIIGLMMGVGYAIGLA